MPSFPNDTTTEQIDEEKMANEDSITLEIEDHKETTANITQPVYFSDNHSEASDSNSGDQSISEPEENPEKTDQNYLNFLLKLRSRSILGQFRVHITGFDS